MENITINVNFLLYVRPIFVGNLFGHGFETIEGFGGSGSDKRWRELEACYFINNI